MAEEDYASSKVIMKKQIKDRNSDQKFSNCFTASLLESLEQKGTCDGICLPAESPAFCIRAPAQGWLERNVAWTRYDSTTGPRNVRAFSVGTRLEGTCRISPLMALIASSSFTQHTYLPTRLPLLKAANCSSVKLRIRTRYCWNITGPSTKLTRFKPETKNSCVLKMGEQQMPKVQVFTQISFADPAESWSTGCPAERPQSKATSGTEGD